MGIVSCYHQKIQAFIDNGWKTEKEDQFYITLAWEEKRIKLALKDGSKKEEWEDFSDPSQNKKPELHPDIQRLLDANWEEDKKNAYHITLRCRQRRIKFAILSGAIINEWDEPDWRNKKKKTTKKTTKKK